MGNRKENTDAVEIPNKKRLLDLKSVYKSRDLQAVKVGVEDKSGNNKIPKRKNRLEGGGDSGGDDHTKKKTKKTRSAGNGEVYGGSFKRGANKSSKSLNEVHSNGVDSVSGELSQSFGNSISTSNGGLDHKSNGISRSLDDSTIEIPRRKRGGMHRRMFDGDNLKLERLSSEKDEIAHQSGELLNDSCNGMVCVSHFEPDPPAQSPKGKKKKIGGDQASNPTSSSSRSDCPDGEVGVLSGGSSMAEDHNPPVAPLKVKQENKPCDSISDRNFNDDAVSVGLNNDNASSSHTSRNRGKRKKSLVNNGSISVKALESSENVGGLQEDDDENLEENAARMLSSRFDTNCIGLSLDFETNGPSLSASSGQNFNGCPSSLVDSEFASGDPFGRALRPRKQQRKQKHYTRPRRHFYEMVPGDLYAGWVVNQKIKVFWPLDKSWYHGLVDDYDIARKLHHVKYDDRDEEWINLQNERFQLLLYPNEVFGKTEIKTPILGVKYAKRERSVKASDGNCVGSSMDSKPITPLFNRSTNHQPKSSSFVPLKKQKTCTRSSASVTPVLSTEIGNAHTCLGTAHSKRAEHKSSKVASAEENSLPRKTSSCEEVQQHIVYFRKRLRQKTQDCVLITDNSCHPPYVNQMAEERCDNPLEDPDRKWDMWSLDGSGLLRLIIPAEMSDKVRVLISVPLLSILCPSLEAVKSWLFNAHLLLTHGSVVTTWPAVHLEMLFVDNTVGLSLFVFEGCLKQAVAYVFLVLTAFHQQTENGKYIDLQMPATSFRVRLSCLRDPRKQVVFAFSNFSKLESSKWLYLEVKLKAQSMLCKKLPLADCTDDNIKALQSGYNQLHLTSVSGEPSSTEVSRSRLKKASIGVGASRKSTCTNAIVPSSKLNVRHGGLPTFSISFTAVPSFFIGLHLKLLMESGVASMDIPDQDSIIIQDPVQSTNTSMLDGESHGEAHNSRSPVFPENGFVMLTGDAFSGKSSCGNSQDTDDALAGGSGADLVDPSQKCASSNHNIAKPSPPFCSPDDTGKDVKATIQVQKQCELETVPVGRTDSSSTGRLVSTSHSQFNGINVEIPSSGQVENHVSRLTSNTPGTIDMVCQMNDDDIQKSSPTTSQNKISPMSFSPLPRAWDDGKANFCLNGLVIGPKKPRTRVSYTLPPVDHRHLQHKGIANKRIRRTNDKRTEDPPKSVQSNPESLRCDANVLITSGDRGWRESGATVVVEPVDRNEWRLAVKLLGITKYSYKAQQFLQPGSINRYSHAMMWRGGKDWVLEFPHRSQWVIFKEMHEECYNRNIRAASVKNIPIPGVQLIEEMDDNETGVAFVRSSTKYFRQGESDVDMVLKSSRIIYDMDSDDEQWISRNQDPSGTADSGGVISDELFEKVMDTFEKAAYAQQRDQFSVEEMEEFLSGVGSVDVIQKIYEHWFQKRQRKGMPLIRQLQPPLWERYQQQLKEYESKTAKTSNSLIEKPVMAAFCLKPRGLEVPNKGSKQRSQRKLTVSGMNNISGDNDSYHPYGRRINGVAFGEERGIIPHTHEFIDASRSYSPREAGSNGFFSKSNDYDRNYHHPKYHRTRSKKIAAYSPNDSHYVSPFSQRKTSNRSGSHQRWNNNGYDDLDGSALDEFRLRDASGAAQHARNISKLKREKAQRLLYRADLAIHKAVVALMTADAIKASSNED